LDKHFFLLLTKTKNDMSGKLLLKIILFIFFAFPAASTGQNLKIMTFNIRFDNPNDGENVWDNRKSELTGMVNYYQPLFLGIQEGLANQLDYMKANLPNYDMIGAGREDGKRKGEYSAIFFDSTEYEKVNEKTFWLSEEDDKVSKGWDAALERICTYGLFREKKSRKLFNVFNTHFDHVGKEARINSAKLILKKMEECTNDSSVVILMGDFNSFPQSEAIQIISAKLNDAFKASKKALYGPEGTFNAFDKDLCISDRIDYIFVKNLDVISCRHIDDKRKNGGFLSDHLPVLIEVKRNDCKTTVH